MRKTSFNKFPFMELKEQAPVFTGWAEIAATINRKLDTIEKKRKIVCIECYHGVVEENILKALEQAFSFNLIVLTKDLFRRESELKQLIGADLTDDPVFGKLEEYTFEEYFDKNRLQVIKRNIENMEEGTILVLGSGAAIITDADLLIYADMARWEIVQRLRRGEVSNLGFENNKDKPSLKYKQAFFFDWRICDRLKQKLFDKWDFYLDTNNSQQPKMIDGKTALNAIKQAANQPLELVPYFDPGPWGGQWMKEVCGLDKEKSNYAWCFNCVPEENSFLIKIEETLIEMPAINIVFYSPVELLGMKVYNRYGAEFPIRFDFLDTMQGGNLSLQVHPTNEYIKEKFNWPYTQDESYYLMDAEPGANVYLGLKEDINKVAFHNDLVNSFEGKSVFPDGKYVEKWPVKKHDHVLIPGGTVHCSGAGCMVLEISATPYIFTFKLWDWERLGLDGTPRPIHIEHGMNVIDFSRTTKWTGKNLVNVIEPISQGDGWREEKTGLHELESIETRRIWFEKEVEVVTGESVNVLNLVEGDEITVESPFGDFAPITVHYAETFIVPCSVKKYIVKPSVNSESKEFAIIRAYIR